MYLFLKGSLTNHMIQTYIFEIVEVVSDPKVIPKRWWKLRLRCRDEAKGPVTAICGFDGYVVSSMGQKVVLLHSVRFFPRHRYRSSLKHSILTNAL